MRKIARKRKSFLIFFLKTVLGKQIGNYRAEHYWLGEGRGEGFFPGVRLRLEPIRSRLLSGPIQMQAPAHRIAHEPLVHGMQKCLKRMPVCEVAKPAPARLADPPA